MTDQQAQQTSAFRRPCHRQPGFRPQLPGSLAAPPERTLVDILQDTAARFPDASALDDGHESLSYAQLLARSGRRPGTAPGAGLGAGDKIGVRIPSGHQQLYISILAILFVGAAYVPVDADDPEERARLVFGEAGVAGDARGAGRTS